MSFAVGLGAGSGSGASGYFEGNSMRPYRALEYVKGLQQYQPQAVGSFEERLADPFKNNPSEEFADYINTIGRFGDPASSFFYPKYNSMPEILYNEDGTAKNNDQFVWADVWDSQQKTELERLQKAWEEIVKRRSAYGNLSKEFSTRGFGPNSGNYATSLGGFSGGNNDMYYKKAQELGSQKTVGGLKNILQALLSQSPGNAFPSLENSLF